MILPKTPKNFTWQGALCGATFMTGVLLGLQFPNDLAALCGGVVFCFLAVWMMRDTLALERVWHLKITIAEALLDDVLKVMEQPRER